MSLRSAALTVPEKAHGPVCGVKKLRNALKGDDLAWLDEHLPLESGFTSTYISNVLKGEGYRVSDSILSHHRSGKCRCDAT